MDTAPDPRREVVEGNAHADGKDRKGWFVGHFLSGGEAYLRGSRDVEVQLRHHPDGNTKGRWTWNRAATTLVLLLRGRFVVEFPFGESLLEREGDYVIWPPGLSHAWRAEGDTLVVTVRWPSLPGDPVRDTSRPPHP